MSRILPILFNTDMVRAILEGRKTVTRRRIKGCVIGPKQEINQNSRGQFELYNITPRCGIRQGIILKQPFQPGDILYVRETFAEWTGGYVYRAWTEPFAQPGQTAVMKWTPSIHMPKEAARIFLKVKDVRVERLQDITEEQAKAEGIREYAKDGKLWKYAVTDDWWIELHRKHRKSFIGSWWQDMPRTAKEAFSYLWNSTIKKSDLDKYGWDANPWVWVIEFERCEKPE